jgi:4-aminobutyrate aminotransferase-like enzyme
MSKSGAHRNVLRICSPLCIAEIDVEFFEHVIEESFRRL